MENADRLILNGFRYDRLTGSVSVRDRLDWLARKREVAHPEPAVVVEDGAGSVLHWELRRGFEPGACRVDPQPYTQLAKVPREQGIAQGAARVLERRDALVSAAAFQRGLRLADGSNRQALTVLVPAQLLRFWERYIMGPVFGYGHRPARALIVVLIVWLLNTALYSVAYRTGQMAPTSDVVLVSQDWVRHVPLDAEGALIRDPPTLEQWDKTAVAKDYTTFSASLYAFDLFIPLDALGQEAAWAPSPVRGWWGTVGFYTGPLTQLLGWIITAIAAAAVAGIVGRKD